MKYAIIKLGGKQLRVSEGDKFEIERQGKLNIQVLAFSDGEKTQLGSPLLENIEVSASVVEEKRGKKVRVGRFKSKSRYHKEKGHRQPLSVIKIEGIGEKGKKEVEKTEKVEKVEKTEKVEKATKTEKSVKKAKAPKKTTTASAKKVTKSKKEAK